MTKYIEPSSVNRAVIFSLGTIALVLFLVGFSKNTAREAAKEYCRLSYYLEAAFISLLLILLTLSIALFVLIGILGTLTGLLPDVPAPRELMTISPESVVMCIVASVSIITSFVVYLRVLGSSTNNDIRIKGTGIVTALLLAAGTTISVAIQLGFPGIDNNNVKLVLLLLGCFTIVGAVATAYYIVIDSIIKRYLFGNDINEDKVVFVTKEYLTPSQLQALKMNRSNCEWFLSNVKECSRHVLFKVSIQDYSKLYSEKAVKTRNDNSID